MSIELTIYFQLSYRLRKTTVMLLLDDRENMKL